MTERWSTLSCLVIAASIAQDFICGIEAAITRHDHALHLSTILLADIALTFYSLMNVGTSFIRRQVVCGLASCAVPATARLLRGAKQSSGEAYMSAVCLEMAHSAVRQVPAIDRTPCVPCIKKAHR